jgi:hypothetical protein
MPHDEAVAYALSLKQPWAALVVGGVKSVEIRSWPTARRGPILIHAAGSPDPRAQAWEQVPDELSDLADLNGGILGACELVDCRLYRTAEAFAADRHLHLNDPGWFQDQVLYGFTLHNPVRTPFRPYGGQVRFFPVRPAAVHSGQD